MIEDSVFAQHIYGVGLTCFLDHTAIAHGGSCYVLLAAGIKPIYNDRPSKGNDQTLHILDISLYYTPQKDFEGDIVMALSVRHTFLSSLVALHQLEIELWPFVTFK